MVDSTNFVEDTWFGEGGYFHSDAMHVIERFWRVGENLSAMSPDSISRFNEPYSVAGQSRTLPPLRYSTSCMMP